MGKSKKKININYVGLGANQMVTGSAHILEIKVNNQLTKIMLDFGFIQDGKLTTEELFEVNGRDLKIDDVDYLVVSHAHLDHSLGIARLKPLGFQSTVITTDLTLQLAEHITLDGVHVHEKTVEYLSKLKKNKHKHVYPYINERTRQWGLDRVKAYDYNRKIKINDYITITLLPAGHISGASMVLIDVQDGYEKETILYSGDSSCSRDIPFTKIPNIEKFKINHFIGESTYGNQNLPQRTEKQVVADLQRIITKTCINKEGNLLIPSFAMSRSTNMVYYLKKTYEKHPELSHIPIYMASPLMQKCHETIGNKSNFCFYDDKWKNEIDLWKWDKVNHITKYQSLLEIMKDKISKILISSSGMADKGYNSFLTQEVVRFKKNAMCFVGYCAENTTGRKY